MNTNPKPFNFGSGSQGQGNLFTFGAGGGGVGKGFPGATPGQSGFGLPSAPSGQQPGQSSTGMAPSLFGHNPPPTVPTPQGQQGTNVFGQGTPPTLFGNNSVQKPGQPGGLFTPGFPSTPLLGGTGHPSGTIGQGAPSIFPPPSGQTRPTGPQPSLQSTTTRPPMMGGMFLNTPAPASNQPSSAPGAQKTGMMGGLFLQPTGQPQSYANPSQGQGGIQLGTSAQLPQGPGTSSFLHPTMQSQSAGLDSATKQGFIAGPQQFPSSQPQGMGQLQTTSIPQPQLHPHPQKETAQSAQLFQTPQPSQPSQLASNLFSTPTPQKSTLPMPSDQLLMGHASQLGMTSTTTQQISNAPQQPQFFTTPQKQPAVASQTLSQFTSPQTQNLLATSQPHSQSTIPMRQPQTTAQVISQTSGQPAIFQLHSSPSTALPSLSAPPSTTPGSAPGPPQSLYGPTAPLPNPQPPPTLQSQHNQPITVAPTTASSITNKITTATATVSLPIVSASTSGSVTQTPAKKYTYRQLEDVINQWVLELGEQQKVFVSQARQINAWDVALLENEESIISLHNEVERAKSDQDRLNHDLDSILTQQSELEEMLRPLEGFLDNQTVHASTQHADQERNKTYGMAEKIDTSMKDMMQNLREVMERINTANSANYDRNNPISQITGILNAHMDSLLLIDDNTNSLQQKVDELSKKLDSKKQDQEIKLKSAFN